jgi:hypothetical protein
MQLLLSLRTFGKKLIKDTFLHQRDLIFVSLLLVVAASIFSVFRPNPLPNSVITCLAVVLLLAISTQWLRKAVSLALVHRSFLSPRDIGALITFAIVTIAVFFPLMLLHIDTGTDLSVVLGVDKVWFQPWADLNRPLAGLGALSAMLITPKSLGGFFFIVLFCRFATAALLYGIIKLLLPEMGNLRFLAGLFYIFNPAELSRFTLWSIVYLVALLFFSAALFFLIFSYQNASRVFLILSCIFLGVSCLQYEHGILMALGTSIFLLLLPRRSYLGIWLLAWYGTAVIFAQRLITYLLAGPQVYQRALFSFSEKPDTLIENLQLWGSNLILQTAPVLRMIPNPQAVRTHWLVFLVLFVSCFIVVRLIVSKQREIKRQLLEIALAGLLLSIVGIIPYIPFPITSYVPDYGTNPTMRYQYFAGLGQAVFWSAVKVHSPLPSDR